MQKKKYGIEYLWDAWCICSGVGLWPRYIEPRILTVTRLALPIPKLPAELQGIKILQFSDLHWSKNFSRVLLRQLVRKINELQPDVIVFTGDFISRSKLEDPQKLQKFLCSLHASVGHFAILGNHDYADFATINDRGDYDVHQVTSTSNIQMGVKRLFFPVPLSKKRSTKLSELEIHQPLIQLLQQTPFQLLHNETQLLPFRNSFLNICGLGDYIAGKCSPMLAFQNYQEKYPGIVLSHNPDSLSVLQNYPGEIILCGHTHGGQVNLPGLWKRFTLLECPQFKRGLKRVQNKWAYINRGISSVMKFRWFSIPELTLFTLHKEVVNDSI